MARYFLKTKGKTIKSINAVSDSVARREANLHIFRYNIYSEFPKLYKATMTNGIVKETEINL